MEALNREIERLVREAKAAAQLEHPNIVPIHSIGVSPSRGVYFTMKRLRGDSLRHIVNQLSQRNPAYTRVYTGSVLMSIFLKICQGINYAHSKGIIHRDLKPENILVTRYGDYPKIIDFGLSDTDSILTGKEPGGTLLYAAPEVVAGGEADALSDIYSLGRIMQGMGPSFARVARKCTAVERERRYSSAEAVARDLRKIHVLRRATFVCILLLLFAGAVGSILSRHRTDPVEELWQEAVEQVRQAANPSR